MERTMIQSLRKKRHPLSTHNILLRRPSLLNFNNQQKIQDVLASRKPPWEPHLHPQFPNPPQAMQSFIAQTNPQERAFQTILQIALSKGPPQKKSTLKRCLDFHARHR
ncbi:hypothetical protein FGO68_gene10003 [Halteria grandinella]|uniref:Uncharacterized protein n=1 Tax=Halteria grandinella TaxID=5974 RepID=A0A8J8P468_HALGN|nr:hypothetical protein FGO68_gene10003 [Halteria grandinella]